MGYVKELDDDVQLDEPAFGIRVGGAHPRGGAAVEPEAEGSPLRDGGRSGSVPVGIRLIGQVDEVHDERAAGGATQRGVPRCGAVEFARQLRIAYKKYRAAHGKKPLYYEGREKWTPIPVEFL